MIPNNIFALQLKSDYHVRLFSYVARQLGEPPVEQLRNYPKAYEMYKNCCLLMKQINDLGYEPMPEETYKKWLKSLEQNKKMQEKIIRP